MNLLLISCVEESEAPQIEMDEDAQIAQVKSWFEENKTKLRLPEKASNFRSESQELILPFFLKKNPTGISFIIITFRMDGRCSRFH